MSLTSFNMMIIEDSNSSNHVIKVECSACGDIKEIIKKEHTRNCRRQSQNTNTYLCTKCYKDLNKNKNIESMKVAWSSNERKELAKAASKKFWDSLDKSERSLHSKKGISEERNQKISEAIRKKFREDFLYRQKQAVARSKMPRISSLQTNLYSILDNLNIKYFKEGDNTKIGFYVFDCLIPKQNNMKRPILIECHGEYWHSLEKSKRNDKAKETFINKYYSEYDFVVFWEYDFLFEKKIISLLKTMCGVDEVRQIKFDFSDLVIDECDYKSAVSFLSKYHYLHAVPRGSKYIGAYLSGELIALFVASRPIRQNVAQTLDLDNNQVLEISRFCIHPCYHKKNLATWFIKRSLKKFDCKAFIAYADSTCGHVGTIYKASNFILDRVVRPDYWYVDGDGFVIHKKTLYNRAVKMGKKESVYAFEHGYKKVMGKEKYRFVRRLK